MCSLRTISYIKRHHVTKIPRMGYILAPKYLHFFTRYQALEKVASPIHELASSPRLALLFHRRVEIGGRGRERERALDAKKESLIKPNVEMKSRLEAN